VSRDVIQYIDVRRGNGYVNVELSIRSISGHVGACIDVRKIDQPRTQANLSLLYKYYILVLLVECLFSWSTKENYVRAVRTPWSICSMGDLIEHRRTCSGVLFGISLIEGTSCTTSLNIAMVVV